MAYERDILDDEPDRRRTMSYPTVPARLGIVVEDRASGFCGDIVKITFAAVTLRDRHGHQRHFTWKPGGFLLEGRPVTLERAATEQNVATPNITNSGSVAGERSVAKVALPGRIWVEGRHDAELVEQVWGDDLRDLGLVVEPLHGADDLAAAVHAFGPAPDRRLGILLDHLVPGSKESRLAAEVSGADVLVTGHPFVDVWAGIRPSVMGLAEWPTVPRGVPWKDGVCAALGAPADTFWPRLRNQVRTYADLRPELVGAVEQLIDFVTLTH